MASAAQILANRANAQQSTGPQSAAGKARASQNAVKHGLATSILLVPEYEKAEFHQFKANLEQATRPEGALEIETCNQILQASWRLRRLHKITRQLWLRYESDPLVTPDAAAELRQLTRYRATLEMVFYRAAKQLRELQTRRAARLLQLYPPEQLIHPPQVNPGIFSAARVSHGDRGLFLRRIGLIGPRITHKVVLDKNHLPLENLVPIKNGSPGIRHEAQEHRA